jgi:hypothetical protein
MRIALSCFSLSPNDLDRFRRKKRMRHSYLHCKCGLFGRDG